MPSAWLTIWTRPRSTIRAFLESTHPKRSIIPLAMGGGVVYAINMASSRNMGDQMPLYMILLISLLVGSISGIIALYVGSFILKITGTWLGGEGSFGDLQVAIARGIAAPTILAGLLWVPELLLFGSEMFTEYTPRLEGSLVLYILYLLLMLVEVILAVWSFVLSVKSIGEAHRFSAVKAFWSWMLPGLILMGIVVLFVLVVGFLL